MRSCKVKSMTLLRVIQNASSSLKGRLRSPLSVACQNNLDLQSLLPQTLYDLQHCRCNVVRSMALLDNAIRTYEISSRNFIVRMEFCENSIVRTDFYEKSVVRWHSGIQEPKTRQFTFVPEVIIIDFSFCVYMQRP